MRCYRWTVSRHSRQTRRRAIIQSISLHCPLASTLRLQPRYRTRTAQRLSRRRPRRSEILKYQRGSHRESRLGKRLEDSLRVWEPALHEPAPSAPLHLRPSPAIHLKLAIRMFESLHTRPPPRPARRYSHRRTHSSTIRLCRLHSHLVILLTPSIALKLGVSSHLPVHRVKSLPITHIPSPRLQ